MSETKLWEKAEHPPNLKIGDLVEIVNSGGVFDGCRGTVRALRGPKTPSNINDRVEVDPSPDTRLKGPYWGHFSLKLVEPVQPTLQESWNLKPYDQMTSKELRKLRNEADKVLKHRRKYYDERRQEQQKGFQGLANFMAGVTWALACRAVLRWSKGHSPVGGKAPMHGAPWYPREIIEAASMYRYHANKAQYYQPRNTNPLTRAEPITQEQLAKVMLVLTNERPPPSMRNALHWANPDSTM